MGHIVQQQVPNRSINTMSASATTAIDSTSPFICNLEHNSRAELQRRRGTSEYDIISPEKGFKFIKSDASDSTNIILESPSNSRLNIDIVCVIYTVEDSTGNRSFRMHITSSDSRLTVVQYTSPIEAFFLDTLGIQAFSDGSTNKFFLYTNQASDPTNTSMFPIMQVNMTDQKQTGFTVGSVVSAGFVSQTAVAKTNNRSITIGINRSFIGELNILYYSNPTANPDADRSLVGRFSFRTSDKIYKIVEFDNAVFVITSRAVYRGIYDNNTFLFTRISDNIYAHSGRAILTATNYVYIPTIDAVIYKVNMKTIRLEDTYSSKIASQMSPLVKHSQPVDSHYDSYNDTLNFTYRHNLASVNEIYSRSSVSSDSSRMGLDNSVESIVLSTHSGGVSGAPESWTTSIFNYDICGVHCVVEFTDGRESSSSYGPALSFSDVEGVGRFSNSFQESLSTPLIVSRYSPKIFKMSYLFRNDDNVNFPVIVGAPMPNFESLLDQGKFMSTSNMQIIFSTDYKQSYSVYGAKKTANEVGIVKAWPAVITGDMSESPVFCEQFMKTHSFNKSAVSVVNCKVNTSAINGIIFLYFSSKNIRTFIRYTVDF